MHNSSLPSKGDETELGAEERAEGEDDTLEQKEDAAQIPTDNQEPADIGNHMQTLVDCRGTKLKGNFIGERDYRITLLFTIQVYKLPYDWQDYLACL